MYEANNYQTCGRFNGSPEKNSRQQKAKTKKNSETYKIIVRSNMNLFEWIC